MTAYQRALPPKEEEEEEEEEGLFKAEEEELPTLAFFRQPHRVLQETPNAAIAWGSGARALGSLSQALLLRREGWHPAPVCAQALAREASPRIDSPSLHSRASSEC